MDIEAEVNPLTKLRLYRVAKKIVFGKMDKKVITPERATEILNYVKEEVAYCDTPEDCHVFYKEVALEFPELADFQDKFERETYEKLDRALSILVEHIFAKGEFDLAERIMDEVEEIKDKRSELIYAHKMERKMPEDFKEAVEEVKQESV